MLGRCTAPIQLLSSRAVLGTRLSAVLTESEIGDAAYGNTVSSGVRAIASPVPFYVRGCEILTTAPTSDSSMSDWTFPEEAWRGKLSPRKPLLGKRRVECHHDVTHFALVNLACTDWNTQRAAAAG